jgi:hypothetical protein
MLKQIEQFQRDAKKLGRDINSIEELKMWIKAENWKEKIKQIIGSANVETILNWISMLELEEEFAEQLNGYKPGIDTKELIASTDVQELRETFLGSWDDWTEDDYQFLLTHRKAGK